MIHLRLSECVSSISKGNVSWSLEDVEEHLSNHNIPCTPEKISKVCEGGWFKELSKHLTEEGNEALNAHIIEVFNL